MQVIVLIIVLLAILAFAIYKINNKFGTKEIAMLLAVIIVSSLVFVLISRNQQEKVPLLFKQKYESEKNIKISKFTYERVNNKTVSSKTNFIYNFDYIIFKNKEEYFCKMNNIKVKKIQDEYIFENFNEVKEECQKN
ncbi:hypothetical protein [Halarcobacter sp.]|uniref:hypothetical protein n=1 Tax=Halarcobacter sp. TaxID=2321133 RepID=UPI002AAA8C2A|nr:hypothetical protein [Halarcobacter sp.]